MSTVEQIDLVGRAGPRFDEILTPEAVDFVVTLDREFGGRRAELLADRQARREYLAGGGRLDFRPETRHIREDRSWRVAAPPKDLLDRRVEITGPPERKMAIHALNSGARGWLADFEDATSPTWYNIVSGQVTLRDAVRDRLDWTGPDGRRLEVTTGELPAILVRPRGWHLVEHHLRVDGRAVSASLVDFGLYLFHNAHRQLERGSGPYFYLPKLESYHEARLWNDVFVRAQELLEIPQGTIRATVLIETVTAAFEMDEILYELRDHAAGLNAGRWDYIFSVIRTFGTRYLLPDRSLVTMTSPFLRAYTDLLVQTCHRRGAHAIGGMAAFIPRRDDPAANESAFAKVRADKAREAADGFDGSWVAHPGLVGPCREVFDERLDGRAHQLDVLRTDVSVSTSDLLAVPPGPVTVAGLRANLSIALRYIHAWLGGTGAVALDGLMEDTATAEISRAQVWQWLRAGVALTDGSVVTRPLVARLLDEEYGRARALSDPGVDSRRRWEQARSLVSEMVFGTAFTGSFTVPAYGRHLATA